MRNEDKILIVNDCQKEWGEAGALAIARSASVAVAILKECDRFDFMDLDYDLSNFEVTSGIAILDFLTKNPKSRPLIIRIGSTSPYGIKEIGKFIIDHMPYYLVDLEMKNSSGDFMQFNLTEQGKTQ